MCFREGLSIRSELTGWLLRFFSFRGVSEILWVCDSRVPTHWEKILPPCMTHLWPRSQVSRLQGHNPLKRQLTPGSSGSLVLTSSTGRSYVGNLRSSCLGALVIGPSVAPLRSFTRLRFGKASLRDATLTRLFKKLLKPYVHNGHFLKGQWAFKSFKSHYLACLPQWRKFNMQCA